MAQPWLRLCHVKLANAVLSAHQEPPLKFLQTPLNVVDATAYRRWERDVVQAALTVQTQYPQLVVVADRLLRRRGAKLYAPQENPLMRL